jgi:hypothetical protein
MQIVLVHSPLNWKRPLSLVGFLIRKITKTYWNHASFLTYAPGGQKFILESDINGVVAIPFKDWAKEQTIAIYDFDYGQAEINKAWGKVGVTKYDFASLLWFGLVRSLTGKYYGFTVERKAAKKFYCYEYLAWVMGMPNYYNILPNEFIKQIEDMGLESLHGTPIKAKDLIDESELD